MGKNEKQVCKKKNERERERGIKQQAFAPHIFTKLSRQLPLLSRNLINWLHFYSQSSDCWRTLSQIEPRNFSRNSNSSSISPFQSLRPDVHRHRIHVYTLRTTECGLTNILFEVYRGLTTSIAVVFVYTSGSINLRHHRNCIKQATQSPERSIVIQCDGLQSNALWIRNVCFRGTPNRAEKITRIYSDRIA